MRVLITLLISLISFPVAAQECMNGDQFIEMTASSAGQNSVVVIVDGKDEMDGIKEYLKNTFFFTDEDFKDVAGYTLVPGTKMLTLFGLNEKRCLDFVLPMNYKDVEGIVDSIMAHKGSKES